MRDFATIPAVSLSPVELGRGVDVFVAVNSLKKMI